MPVSLAFLSIKSFSTLSSQKVIKFLSDSLNVYLFRSLSLLNCTASIKASIHSWHDSSLGALKLNVFPNVWILKIVLSVELREKLAREEMMIGTWQNSFSWPLLNL